MKIENEQEWKMEIENEKYKMKSDNMEQYNMI